MKTKDILDLACSAYDLRVEALESASDFDSLLASKLARKLEQEAYRRAVKQGCTEKEVKEILSSASVKIH